MVKSCCAYNCTNEWAPNRSIKFHKFPLNDPQKLHLWIQAVRRKNFNPISSTVICSEHFKEDDYLESSVNQNLLKRDAVPSIFNFTRHILESDNKRRKLLDREEPYEEPEKMENQERICRFCLMKCTSNFTFIEETTKKILDTLLVKINLSISDQPVLCTNCSAIIQRCFTFKSKCLYTEDKSVIPFNNEKGEKREETIIPDDYNICRFCMDLIKNEDQVIISEIVMLEKCFPEVDVAITKNTCPLPVICSVCHECLQNYFSFLINCSKVEEMVNKYYESVNRQGLIKLKDVLQFTTKNLCEGGGSISGISDEEEKNVVEVVDDQKFTNLLQCSPKTMCEWKDDVDRVEVSELQGSLYGEHGIKIEQEHENLVQMEDQELDKEIVDQKFNGILQYSSIDMFASKDDDYKDDETDDMFLKEEEIKIEDENENCVEIECPQFVSDEEIEVGAGHQNVNSFQNNILPHPEVGSNLSKSQVLHPATSRSLSHSSCYIDSYRTFVDTYRPDMCLYSNIPKNDIECQLSQERPSENSSELKIFKCDSCPYETKYRSNLKIHSVVHKSPSEIAMFACDSCQFQTKYQSNFIMHSMVHKDASEVNMFKCDFCPYQTQRKDYLSLHLTVHKDSLDVNALEVNMFKCDSCPYQTKHKLNLRMHMLEQKDASEVNMFKCEFCSYQVKRKNCLKRHMLIHKVASELTVFKCGSCPYQTKRKVNLTAHMLVHKDASEVNMFKCDFCPYQAKRKDSLRKHMLVHKDDSEVTMFKCDSCLYQTKHKENLRKHILLHKVSSKVNMFKCESCSYQTEHRADFKVHNLKHKNSTMFMCESCPYQTKLKSNLQKHVMWKHKDSSEIKIYKCEYCSFWTKFKNSYIRHKFIKHEAT